MEQLKVERQGAHVAYSTLLRWILLPFAAAGSWYTALAAGLIFRGVLHAIAFRFCKDKRVVSGDLYCFDSWYNPLMDLATYAGAGFAAFLILFSCVGMAPSRKRVVTMVTFALGVATAAYAGITLHRPEGYIAMASAMLVGVLTTIWLGRKHARSNLRHRT
jgi:hypothetical protein